MLDILRSLKSLVKVARTHIDNEIFRLHYTFTVLVLLAFCIVVTTKQYVGDPIDCIHGHEIPSNIINTYCWIHTTFTIPSAFSKKSDKFNVVFDVALQTPKFCFPAIHLEIRANELGSVKLFAGPTTNIIVSSYVINDRGFMNNYNSNHTTMFAFRRRFLMQCSVLLNIYSAFDALFVVRRQPEHVVSMLFSKIQPTSRTRSKNNCHLAQKLLEPNQNGGYGVPFFHVTLLEEEGKEFCDE
ncbi:unnamed protein product [Larinioides sclopetarius]|uniref:Innexin n=1 Tax=Larinioides sclopetarius TaxID=280406 RepID=A0AAV2BTY4_9ARAC